MNLEPDKTEIGGGIRIVEQCRLEVLEQREWGRVKKSLTDLAASRDSVRFDRKTTRV